MPARGLCALKIGGWAPHELHEHEAEEVARDEAEGVRLAYVAATRARDLLVVPAVGDEPWDGGWLSPLNRALYPPVDDAPQRRRAGRSVRRSSRRTPCCSGRTTSRPALRTVCPGLHTFAARDATIGRLVGSRRAEARREAAVRRPPRGPDRQGRAAERRRRRPQPRTTAGISRAPTRARAGRVPSLAVDDGSRMVRGRIPNSELQRSEFVTDRR